MKLGGLFSGIGGFELAWTRLGGEVAWMCEWDKNARKVLEARFPGVPIYPDVRDLDPAEVEAVDVLTGGSPCQGFSVAGNRTGLEHSESQLFADYIRIMDGLAERGLKWALWENVPGVLSIEDDDGNRTFEHVVAALAGGTRPVRLDPERRWNTGLASGRGRAVAWRVLDSRYFGVAQRRRRVFACVTFGGACEDRAGRALLAVAEGVRRDSAASVSPGQGAAGGVEVRVGVPSVTGPLTTGGIESPRGTETSDSGFVFPDIAEGVAAREGAAGGVAAGVGSAFTLGGHGHYVEGVGTLRSAGGDLGGGSETMVIGSTSGATSGSWCDGGDTADALTTTSDAQRMPDKQRLQAVVQAQSFNWQQGHAEYALADDASALAADSRPAVLMTMREGKPGGGKGPLLVEEESLTLATGNGQTLFQPQAFDEMNFTTSDQHHVLRAGTKQSTGVVEPWHADSVGTLKARAFKGLNTEEVADGQAVVQTYGVRRLTPVECERLQAFPDGWTEPAGSDSARYKALGNAVTVNTVGWILRRMKAQG